MAKLLLPSGWQLSGKSDGTVFSRNRFGAYVRTKTVPVNPNTGQQSVAREAFRTATGAWKALSNADRAAWNTFAAAYVYIDVFGQSKKLTGAQLFIGANARQSQLGLPTSDTPGISVPPTSPAINYTPFAQWTSDALSLATVGGANWVIPTGFSVVLWSTGPVPVSNGFSSVKNQLRLLGIAANATETVEPGTDSPVEAYKNLYNAVFTTSPVSPNEKTYMVCQMVHNASGIVSNTFQIEATF